MHHADTVALENKKATFLGNARARLKHSGAGISPTMKAVSPIIHLALLSPKNPEGIRLKTHTFFQGDHVNRALLLTYTTPSRSELHLRDFTQRPGGQFSSLRLALANHAIDLICGHQAPT